MRKLFAVAACVAAVAGVTASASLAGEVNGNGDPTGAPAHANSICVFSGQNDYPDGSQSGPPGRTQTYGQDVKAGRLDPSTENPGKVGRLVPTDHPGYACNGEHGYFSGGGGD